jgi:hypothetical protein
VAHTSNEPAWHHWPLALTFNAAFAAAAAAALQSVTVWKGTIREYKAKLAKKMGVVH